MGEFKNHKQMLANLSLITEHGYVIYSREAFMSNNYITSLLTAYKTDELNQKAIDGLRARVNELEGGFVVFDPRDNEDGFLLVGNDIEELASESAQYIREIQE